MSRMLLRAAILFFVTDSVCLGDKAERKADPKEQGSTSLFGTDLRDDVAQDVGSFTPSKTLLGKRVYSDDGTPVGKVDDIIIDPYSGMATTFVVAPTTAGGPSYRSLIPLRLVTPIRLLRLTAAASAEKIAGGPTLGKASNARPYRRQLATVPFDYYGLRPPWASAPVGLEKKYGDEDTFVYAKALQGTPVLDGEKSWLGYIDDLTISWDNGKIAYAVVSTGDKQRQQPREFETKTPKSKRHAIPLGAFVVKPKWRAWVIELPAHLLDDTHAIPPSDKWPADVSLGWTRYVQERYGESMLSGIQRELARE